MMTSVSSPAVIHSRFSPATMPARLLERTFVQRTKLAARLEEIFAESARSGSKHNVLLAGPRGIGKSHLVTLVYHRLKQNPELQGRLAFAFLREDEWGVNSYLDLLVRILRALHQETRETAKAEAVILPLGDLPRSRAEQEAWTHIERLLNGRTLLVIVENFASMLANLGEAGQRQWRALMQNHPCWCLLATTPVLSGDISLQEAPFYGFFEVHHLEALSAEESLDLFHRLATVYDGEASADTPESRARVGAIHHLAGGNHRVLVMFYDHLRHEAPGEILAPLLKTLDALTPYYQAQIEKLSPQQRKIVGFLCERRSAVNVKTIAAGCFLGHSTAAGQLKHLLEARYVRVTRIGRESFYEMAEPLFRISVEVAAYGAERLRLLVGFLRYWFSGAERKEMFGGPIGEVVSRYHQTRDERVLLELPLELRMLIQPQGSG